jgi:NAD-dependent dihydropyrimidine dehydrogenase PreA subunit
MVPKNPFRPFTPDPEMVSRLPEITGNEINGVGETEVRRPRMVYWAPDPDDIEFGEVQKWFYQHEPPDPVLMEERARRKAILEAPMPDLATEPAERSPDEWTRSLDAFVDAGDCERVGVARLRPEWVFVHHETSFANVIVLGVKHEYDLLKHVPDQVGGAEVTRQYGRAAAAAKKVAGWLREQGWDAEPVTGPMVGKILMIPPAVECGFGELGKHGSLVNPEFGSGFRLGAVLTDAPFATTPKREFGIDDFCSRCRVCENACPPFAIKPEKEMVRGVHKWYVEFDKCIPFFAETSGCAICIAVCPWTRPEVGLNLAAKLARRSKRLERGDSSGIQ